jgi:hypothetical protein
MSSPDMLVHLGVLAFYYSQGMLIHREIRQDRESVISQAYDDIGNPLKQQGTSVGIVE